MNKKNLFFAIITTSAMMFTSCNNTSNHESIDSSISEDCSSVSDSLSFSDSSLSTDSSLESSLTTDNSPFWVSAIPQDFIYKNRHYSMITSPGVKNEVNNNEIGDLLGYIIRESDIDSFILEYGDIDYVIDNYVYDYYNNNRVPFYKVIGYEDLSFICCNYFLYQDITNFLK